MPRSVLVAASLLFVAPFCFAAGPGSANVCLHGQVVDSSGTAIAGAAIAAERTDGGHSGSAVSDARGNYQVCDLQPGQYRIVVRRAEFEDSVRYETVGFDGDSPLDISLERGSGGRPAAQEPMQEAQISDSSMAPGDSGFSLGAAARGDGSAADGVDGVGEFHAGSDATFAQGLPDGALASKKNLPHGELYGLKGLTQISATDVTLQDELPIHEFGASLGGNTRHGGTSYFASYDQFGLSDRKLQSFLTSVQAQTGSNALPLDTNPVASSMLVARADHQFSQRDSAFVRFNRDDLHSYALQTDQATATQSLTKDIGIKQETATAGNTVTISPNTVNETQAQFISNDLALPAGASEIGVQSGLPTVHRNRIFEAANNVYRQVGGQGVRAGGDFIYNQMNISFLESSLGRAAAGNSSFSQSDRSAGLYVLSTKSVRPNVVLTSGVRYDIVAVPGFKTDTNNVSPQVGVAWSPSSRTVIRGGGGIYYDQIPLPAIAGPTDAGGVANIQNSGRFVSRNGLTAAQLGDFSTSIPTMQNSYAEHASLEVEQQIGAHSVLQMESQYVRGVQLALPSVRGVALCSSTRACSEGSTFGGQEIGSGAVSSYAGTTLAFTQEPVRWGNYKVSYTYASAQGSGTGVNTSQVNDLMRRASFTGVLHTSSEPGSDLWQHVEHGFVLTGTGDYTNRAEFAGMNFINFNARLTKTLAWGRSYRVDVLAETFNMMQRTNAAFARSAAEMGDSAASIYSTYQRVASFQSPNGSELGMRVTF